MRTGKSGLARVASTILLLLVICAVSTQQGASTPSMTVISVTPSSTVITAPPVLLTVIYVYSNGSVFLHHVDTDFWVIAPGDTLWYAGRSGTNNGQAFSSYNPPVAGTYSWYVNATFYYPDGTSGPGSFGPWAFTCAITAITTTLIQYSWTTQTVTVGLATTYSYIYYTQTQYYTAYKTQTVSITSTSRSYVTVSTTSTGYKTTQTLPITTSETVTRTQVSYSPITMTSYVYIESYVHNSTSVASTTQANSSGPWDVLSAFTQLPSFASIPGYVIVLGSTCVAAAAAAYVGLRAFNARRRVKRLSNPEMAQDMDQTVLDYITSHDGNISMRKASEDLNLPMDSIATSIQGLKQAGRLKTT